MKKLCMLLPLALSCVAQGPLAPDAGSLSGLLRGDDGSAIEGAYISVRYQRVVPPGRSLPPLTGSYDRTARSATDGSFRLEHLRPGDYLVCVQAPRSHWLALCDWGATPLKVSIGPGQAATAHITLRKGAILPIRVEDPARTLALNEGKTPGAHLLAGVGAGDALFRPALLVSEDGTGRTYHSLVPFDVPVKVVLSSSAFQLADERGASQPKTTILPVIAPRGQAQPAVRVIVTGSRNP
jgi:hypothetical protein